MSCCCLEPRWFVGDPTLGFATDIESRAKLLQSPLCNVLPSRYIGSLLMIYADHADDTGVKDPKVTKFKKEKKSSYHAGQGLTFVRSSAELQNFVLVGHHNSAFPCQIPI